VKVAKTWTPFWLDLAMQEVLGFVLGVVWIVASLVATFVFGFNWLWSMLVCGLGVTVAWYIVVPYLHPPGADGEWTKPMRPELQRRNNVTGVVLAVTVLAILVAFFYKFFVKQ
jgi:hypothetical protein